MARLFGCLVNVEAEEEGGGGGGGNSIAGEVSRSGMQPDGEAMSLSVGSPPLVERENNPYLRFLESKPDSGSAPMDSESDLHNCYIDFFDREPYEVDEFHTAGPNHRPSPCNFDIWGDDDMEEEKIELGLGIGSGSGSGSGSESESGQRFGDSGGVQVTGNKEIDSGRVEVVTDLTPGLDDLFVVEVGTGGIEYDDLFGEGMVVDDGEFEWEDSQNAMTWVSDPVQVTSLFSLEEEEGEEEEEEGGGGEEPSLAYRDDDLELQDIHNPLSTREEWQVLLHMNHLGLLEDSYEAPDFMDMDYDLFLSTIDELGGEPHGDYDYVLLQTFDQEPGITPRPPASKSVVDGLPLVEFTSQELSSGNIVCAICTDDILVEENVNRLPCRHYYHGDCIIPWLGIRNTCPVCRYELPTDDLEYERNRRSQRQGT